MKSVSFIKDWLAIILPVAATIALGWFGLRKDKEANRYKNELDTFVAKSSVDVAGRKTDLEERGDEREAMLGLIALYKEDAIARRAETNEVRVELRTVSDELKVVSGQLKEAQAENTRLGGEITRLSGLVDDLTRELEKMRGKNQQVVANPGASAVFPDDGAGRTAQPHDDQRAA